MTLENFYIVLNSDMKIPHIITLNAVLYLKLIFFKKIVAIVFMFVDKQIQPRSRQKPSTVTDNWY